MRVEKEDQSSPGTDGAKLAGSNKLLFAERACSLELKGMGCGAHMSGERSFTCVASLSLLQYILSILLATERVRGREGQTLGLGMLDK